MTQRNKGSATGLNSFTDGGFFISPRGQKRLRIVILPRSEEVVSHRRQYEGISSPIHTLSLFSFHLSTTPIVKSIAIPSFYYCFQPISIMSLTEAGLISGNKLFKVCFGLKLRRPSSYMRPKPANMLCRVSLGKYA